MPQLLILAAIGAGAYFGTKWIRNKARQITRDMERAAKAANKRTAGKAASSNIDRDGVDELEKDPATGVYRVKKK